MDFAKGSIFKYIDEETGEIGEYKAYDSSEKTWRHMNFFGSMTNTVGNRILTYLQ